MRRFFLSGSFRQVRALVGLRYRLIFAQARSGQGRVAVLFALYLLGAMAALFLALGGMGMAVGAVRLGRGESIARWVLTGLCVNGVGLSLLFGFGARAVFAEASLRRYPLPASQRFAIRHWIGLLDPVWLALMASSLGLVGGLLWLGAGSPGWGIAAVLLFIPTAYLMTGILLTMIGRAMRTRLGTAIFGGAMILCFSIGQVAIASLAPDVQRSLWRLVDGVLRWTPPGLAAGSMMAGDQVSSAVRLLLLLVWLAGLVITLRSIERLPEAAGNLDDQHAAALTLQPQAAFEDAIWQIARIFGRRYAPLIDKSLRYHLRCNLIRYSLVTSPLLVVAIRFLDSSGRPGGFIITSALIFYVLSCATGAAMMLNLFGFDGAGISRHALLPAPMGDALRAGSIASLLLRLVVLLISFIFWLILFQERARNWREMALLIGVALTGTLLFSGIGIWVSILAPKRADFDSIWNNRLSLGANIIVIAGVLLPFYAGLAIVDRFGHEVLLRFWWIPLLTAIPGGAVYVISFFFSDPALRLQREHLLRTLAGVR